MKNVPGSIEQVRENTSATSPLDSVSLKKAPCLDCGAEFVRTTNRGPPPHRCPNCKQLLKRKRSLFWHYANAAQANERRRENYRANIAREKARQRARHQRSLLTSSQ